MIICSRRAHCDSHQRRGKQHQCLVPRHSMGERPGKQGMRGVADTGVEGPGGAAAAAGWQGQRPESQPLRCRHQVFRVRDTQKCDNSRVGARRRPSREPELASGAPHTCKACGSVKAQIDSLAETDVARSHVNCLFAARAVPLPGGGGGGRLTGVLCIHGVDGTLLYTCGAYPRYLEASQSDFAACRQLLHLRICGPVRTPPAVTSHLLHPLHAE